VEQEFNPELKYLFTGQELESEISSTSFWNFRARMFNSDIGLFYAPDPAHQGYSRYGYCLGNPISFIDPTGRWGQMGYYIEGLNVSGQMFGSQYETMGSHYSLYQQRLQYYQGIDLQQQKEEEDRRQQALDDFSTPTLHMEPLPTSPLLASAASDLLSISDININTATTGINQEGIEGQKKSNSRTYCGLTLASAHFQWTYGRGAPVYVDLASIDLSRISPRDFPSGVGSKRSFNLLDPAYFSSLEDGLIYGQLFLTLQANNYVKATYGYDTYDFDMHALSVKLSVLENIKIALRDVATLIGRMDAGPGQPFKIILMGQAKIDYR
jgi:RHS repeat-associated protein